MNDNNYLIHYGVVGMKWGVRRYQNYDGTRTSLGKRHEKKLDKEKLFNQTIPGGKDKPKVSPAEKSLNNISKVTDETKNIIDATQRIKKRNAPKPDYSHMSDKELRDKINRINMERQYTQLTQEDTRVGLETAKDVLSIIGSVAAITAATVGTYSIIKNLIG